VFAFCKIVVILNATLGTWHSAGLIANCRH
jgi:hypothetical protein